MQTTTFAILFLISAALAAETMFPKSGVHEAGVFVIGASQEAEAVAAKIQRALADDPKWIQQYLEEKRPAPGEMPPYHPKMGVTKKEYDLFVSSIGKMFLRRVGDARVRVERTENQVRVAVEGVAWPISEFMFTLDGRSMSCSLGKSTESKQINQSDASSPTGRWSGTQWSFQKGAPDISSTADFLSVKIAIGTDDQKRTLIYTRIVGRIDGGGVDIGDVIRW
jgi:hypothetical protein